MPDASIITITKAKRRTLALEIEKDGTLSVKAPLHASKSQIDEFLKKHKVWIDKRLTLIRERKKNGKKEGEYLFLGNKVTLMSANITEISVKGDTLFFPQGLLFRKDKEITSWYLAKAREIITQQVEFFADEMKAEYKEITFSDTKSQWGRCTHDNRLQFSWRLIMAPFLVINYVVIHELAHTKEKNHTQMFWMKVRNFNPSYRQQIKWLKEHGHALKA